MASARYTLATMRGLLIPVFSPGLTTDQQNAQINSALEWIIGSDEWRGALQTVWFKVYHNIITLPWNLERLDEIASENEIVMIQNQWYEFSMSGPGLVEREPGNTVCDNNSNIQARDMGEGFCTFADICEPSYIKVQCDLSETGNILLQGLDENGYPIYTGTPEILGVNLALTSGTQTTQQFTSLQAVIKPITNGRIKLYSVSVATSEQKLIAVYNPSETVPNYRRYRLTGIFDNPQRPTHCHFKTLCKLCYQPLLNDNDIVIPSNSNAMENVIIALNFRRNSDLKRSEEYFLKGIEILNKDLQEQQGSSELGSVNIQFRAFSGRGIRNLI
jgi:hypothetical protein